MPNFIAKDDSEQALAQRRPHGQGHDALHGSTAETDDLNDSWGREIQREVNRRQRQDDHANPTGR